MKKLTVVILKCEVSVSLEPAMGKSIGLPSQEVVTFAKSLTLHPEIEKVYIGTSVKKTSKQTRWGDKLELIEYTDNFLKNMDPDSTHVVFWNGMIFFPGGEVNKFIMNSYARFADASRCHRYIVNTDNRIHYTNIENEIRNRKWKADWEPLSRFNPSNYSKEITHFTQSADLEAFERIHSKQDKVRYVTDFKQYVHVPLYLMPLFTHHMEFNPEPRYDFIFTSQNYKFMKAYRLNAVDHYFTNLHKHGFKTVLIGKDADKVLPDAAELYLEQVKYHDLKNAINNCRAQLVVAEKSYEEARLYPNRIAEGVASNVVNFIHHTVDPEKILFPNDELKDFLYVKDQEGLIERLTALQSNDYRKHICDLQTKCMGPDQKKQMIKTVVNTFKRNMDERSK